MMQWLTENWRLKLISFLIAVGLWYYAVGEEGVEIMRNVPLVVKVKNPHMSVLKTSVATVSVTFQSPRSLVSDITSKDFRAIHEIGAEVKNAGDYSFRLEPREIQVPSPQIRVAKIQPEVIAVTLDELIVKKLEIKPNFVGDPAFGYQVDQNQVELNPNAILIEGAKGELEKLDSIKTEPIDLVGRVRSFRRTLGLVLPPNVKTLSEALIDGFIPIQEEFDEKAFENVPLRILKTTEDIKVDLDPKTVSFVLKGAKRELEKLTPEGIKPYLDVSNLQSGTHEIPVALVLPEHVTIKDSSSLVVKVTLKK